MVVRSLLALTAAATLAIAPGATAKEHWTRAFTASLWQPNDSDVIRVENQTLRTRLRVNAGGEAVRIRLSNEFGSAPVNIGNAVVRTNDGRMVPVTFAGRSGTRIAVGAPIVSDAVPLTVDPFDILELLIYFPDPALLVDGHDARADKSDLSLPGDFSTTAQWTATAMQDRRPLVAGIDVLSAQERPIIVAMGDSITDANSCPHSDTELCRWSDVLARRLLAAGNPHVVVNQGIGGNTIVAPVTGPSAQKRLDRDVLAIPGVSHLLLLEGINDIGKSSESGVTLDELIAAYRQITLRAQAHDIKVIAMTVMPYEGAGYFRPEGEAMRQRLNSWLRGAGIFDAVFDMEKIVADPANPRKLRSDLQIGDNLHPNAAGQRAMGQAIPLSLFR